MKKTVTIFCLIAMFMVASCASDTEPEPEPEPEPELEAKMTLEERAGAYVKQDDKKNMFVLHTDGTATYVHGGYGNPIQLNIGSSDSTDTFFVSAVSQNKLAGIKFNPDDPSEVDYYVTVTVDGEGELDLGDAVTLKKVEF